MCELLWSDPQPYPGRGPSKRGVGLSFGVDVTKRFLQENNLGTSLLICILFMVIFCWSHSLHAHSLFDRFSCAISWSKGWRLWDWTWWQAYYCVFCSKLLWSGMWGLTFLIVPWIWKLRTRVHSTKLLQGTSHMYMYLEM